MRAVYWSSLALRCGLQAIGPLTRRCQDEKRLAAKRSGCDTDAVWNGLSRRHSLARAEHVLPCSLGVSSSTLLGGPFDFSASREGTCEPASHVTGIYIHHECHYEQLSPTSLCYVRSCAVKLYTARKRSSGRPPPRLVAVRRGIQISDRASQRTI